MKSPTTNYKLQTGYAALTTTIITLVVSLTIISGLTFFSFQEVNINRAFIKSIESGYASEAGVEDAVYRVVTGKQTSTPETIAVGNSTATINITTSGNQRIIRSEGKRGVIQQNLEAKLDITSQRIGLIYGVQIGEGGLKMKNNSRVEGSAYSNGDIIGNSGAVITGDAFAAAGKTIKDISIGGNANAHTINNAIVTRNSDTFTLSQSTVNGNVKADSISNCIINGTAAYNSKNSCTIIGAETSPTIPPADPPAIPLPISTSTIDAWKTDAASYGTCIPPQCDSAGNFKISNGGSASMGPKKINGKLEVDNLATLIITGTIWVEGDIILSNNCIIRLSPGYRENSGVIITDGKLVISNNCAFLGSGDPKSFIMAISTKDSPTEEIITVDNNSSGVIYYAGKGRIKFSNNARANQATAYGITLDNNAVLTYDTGLANAKFSVGPSGGFDIKYWKEVE